MRRHRELWQPGDGALAAIAVSIFGIVIFVGWAALEKLVCGHFPSMCG